MIENISYFIWGASRPKIKYMKNSFLLVHQIPYSNVVIHYIGRKLFRRVTLVAE